MLLNEEKLILNFSLFNNWEEKYEYLIELGEDICFIDPEKKAFISSCFCLYNFITYPNCYRTYATPF